MLEWAEMDRVTEFIKNLNYVIGRTSLAIFALGVFFIFVPSISNNLKFWDWNLPVVKSSIEWGQLFFFLGLLLIPTSGVYQLKIWIKIQWLRRMYPVSKLETEFFVVDVKGNQFLLDTKNKRIRWISNWQTLSDLLFNGYVIVLYSVKEREQQPYNLTSEKIESKARDVIGGEHLGTGYKFGEKLYTRGIPGT